MTFTTNSLPSTFRNFYFDNNTTQRKFILDMMPAVRIFRDRKEVVRRMDLKKLNSTFRIF